MESVRPLQTALSKAPTVGPVLELPEAGEFSIVFLPDTQYYPAHYPEIFRGQTQWIVDNRTRFNIQAVLHEGDSVNGNEAAQWANAAAAIGILDAAELPYLITIGNHDYDIFSDADRRATAFNAAFPQARYTAHAWWQGGFYGAGHTENAYCLLTIGDVACLFLSLEFGPRQAVIDWAHDVLAQHRNRWVVMVTHSFLYIDGTRVSPGDEHNPKDYPLGTSANDGEDLWTKLASLHDNIHLVQNGHHIGGNAAYRKDESRGGTAVHQVFANWQEAANGGDGWLRLVTFGNGRARVLTYSPALGLAKAEAENKFVITL